MIALKKILSVILSFIFLFPSYLCSFLPSKADTDFVIEAITAESDKDPSVAPQTSYIATVKYDTFRSFVPSEYNYFIATGTVDEMRASFDKLR